MKYNFPVSVAKASYCNSPVVMYIHFSATAVLPYISSYSIFFIFTSFISGLNVVKLFCINTNSFLMLFWQKHNTMNFLFMLFFISFSTPIYIIEPLKKLILYIKKWRPRLDSNQRPSD